MMKSEWKSIYVMDFGNKEIKIGISKEVQHRMHTHEVNIHKKCKNLYYTEKCSNPFEIEKEIQKKLANSIDFGKEWFKVSYEEAVSVVKKAFEEKAEFIDTTMEDHERIDRFIDYLFDMDNTKQIIEKKDDETSRKSREDEIHIWNPPHISLWHSERQETINAVCSKRKWSIGDMYDELICLLGEKYDLSLAYHMMKQKTGMDIIYTPDFFQYYKELSDDADYYMKKFMSDYPRSLYEHD